MNKLSYSAFKTVQYASTSGADPFEGLPVEYNSQLVAVSSATTGDCIAIIGDFGRGAQANFPNGEEVKFTFDPYSLAENGTDRADF